MLYTSALGRLAEVTQVVSPAEGHVFHNRLTHTLEVAQIAQRLAERLKTRSVLCADLDPAFAEAAALAHDIGHPPFGHVAERTLDELVRREDVADGFEGNAQSFRIVTRLAAHSKGYRGLNLTRGTLNAILKYPWRRGEQAAPREDKFGFYVSELEYFKFARSESVGFGKSLEAAVMDHADAVAYSVHDLVDFYRAGLIPLELFDDGKTLDREIDSFREAGRVKPAEVDTHRDHIKNLVTLLPIGIRYRGTFDERAELRASSSRLINDFLADVTITEDHGDPALGLPDHRRVQMKFLQNLVWRHVIRSSRLAAQQWGQQRIVRKLFRTFLRSIRDRKTDHGLMIVPAAFVDYVDRIPADGDTSPPAAQEVRLAADIVASLSDAQAIAIYRRLMGERLGSITDAY